MQALGTDHYFTKFSPAKQNYNQLSQNLWKMNNIQLQTAKNSSEYDNPRNSTHTQLPNLPKKMAHMKKIQIQSNHNLIESLSTEYSGIHIQ